MARQKIKIEANVFSYLLYGFAQSEQIETIELVVDSFRKIFHN